MNVILWWILLTASIVILVIGFVVKTPRWKYLLLTIAVVLFMACFIILLFFGISSSSRGSSSASGSSFPIPIQNNEEYDNNDDASDGVRTVNPMNCRWVLRYNAALSKNPMNTDAWFQLGVALLRSEEKTDSSRCQKTVSVIMINGFAQQVNARDCFVRHLELDGENYKAWGYLARYLVLHSDFQFVRVNSSFLDVIDCYMKAVAYEFRRYEQWGRFGNVLRNYFLLHGRYPPGVLFQFPVDEDGMINSTQTSILTDRACYLQSLNLNSGRTNSVTWRGLIHGMHDDETVTIQKRTYSKLQAIVNFIDLTSYHWESFWGWYQLGMFLKKANQTMLVHGLSYSSISCFMESVIEKPTAEGWFQLGSMTTTNNFVSVGEEKWTKEECFLKVLQHSCEAPNSDLVIPREFNDPPTSVIIHVLLQHFQIQHSSVLCSRYFQSNLWKDRKVSTDNTSIINLETARTVLIDGVLIFACLIIIVCVISAIFGFRFLRDSGFFDNSEGNNANPASLLATANRHRNLLSTIANVVQDVSQQQMGTEGITGADQEMLPSAASILQQLPHPANADLQSAQTPEGYHLISPTADCEDNCVICLQRVTSQQCISTPCSHTMHLACLRDHFGKAIQQNKWSVSCPSCQSHLAIQMNPEAFLRQNAGTISSIRQRVVSELEAHTPPISPPPANPPQKSTTT